MSDLSSSSSGTGRVREVVVRGEIDDSISSDSEQHTGLVGVTVDLDLFLKLEHLLLHEHQPLTVRITRGDSLPKSKQLE